MQPYRRDNLATALPPVSACVLPRATTVAVSGADQIWVKSGMYTPIALKNAVKIIGGFAGTATAASQSNPAVAVTTIEGTNAV